MDAFIQKLIDNTNSGDLDYVWKYTDASDTYTFVIPKHYLSGMKFSLQDEPDLMIFPNGLGVNFGKSDLNILRDVIDVSLERTVDTSMSLYTKEDTADVQTSDPTQPKPEADKQSSDSSVEPAPSSDEDS